MPKDSFNPITSTTANDPAAELIQIVIDWERGHRNLLSAAQQTAIINAITSIMNGTYKI